MSKELANAHDVHVASFAGGRERGPCVQVDVTDGLGANADFGTVQLTRIQAEFVRDVLSKWLGPRACPMCGDPDGYGHVCPERSN